MIIGEFARKASKVVFTTSDAGAKYLYNYLNRTGRIGCLDTVMSEYIAFKFAIAAEEIYNAVPNNKAYNDTFNALSLELKNALNSMPPSMNYGLTYNKLNTNMREYAFNSPFEISLLFALKTFDMIPRTAASELYNITKQDVNNSFARIANGQSANAGCGCASVIACMSLLIIMIGCMILL